MWRLPGLVTQFVLSESGKAQDSSSCRTCTALVGSDCTSVIPGGAGWRQLPPLVEGCAFTCGGDRWTTASALCSVRLGTTGRGDGEKTPVQCLVEYMIEWIYKGWWKQGANVDAVWFKKITGMFSKVVLVLTIVQMCINLQYIWHALHKSVPTIV